MASPGFARRSLGRLDLASSSKSDETTRLNTMDAKHTKMHAYPETVRNEEYTKMHVVSGYVGVPANIGVHVQVY